MAGYIRQDTANNIADGNIINASDFDNEYDAIEDAFHASTGHTHDGTTAEGAPITKIGPTQDVVASASALTPKLTNTVDLGSNALRYKELWLEGAANLNTALTVANGGTGATTLTGYVKGSGTSAFTASASVPVGDITGTLPVANGGTGAATFTANNVLLGNDTSAFQVVAPGASGNVLTSNGTTWASAAIPPGGLTYVYKTANYTASDKEGVLADTSGGAFTVTLPATPATGDQVVVADAGSNWGTNNLTVGRNGSTINGTAQDLVCDITGVSVQLVYDGTTWEVYAQVGGNGGTAVTLDGVQTLTNKDLSSPTNTFPTLFSNSTSLAQMQAVALSF